MNGESATLAAKNPEFDAASSNGVRTGVLIITSSLTKFLLPQDDEEWEDEGKLAEAMFLSSALLHSGDGSIPDLGPD